MGAMKEIVRYPGCFVCGEKNEIGLGARFYWDGRKAICDIVADEKYCGYRHLFHGGIVATILDEVMIKALLAEDQFVVTAEMTIRFKKPVHTGDHLRCEGWLTEKRGTVYRTAGTVVNQDGETVAEATGKYIRPKGDLSGHLLESLE